MKLVSAWASELYEMRTWDQYSALRRVSFFEIVIIFLNSYLDPEICGKLDIELRFLGS